ncbi:MAG: condensation domain-containing protein [Bacteroidales bacterium]|nr:condensation domain-containing protein [Bacteroidales bacterium]
MEKQLYSFNSSQDVVYLQTTKTLFRRVENIIFSTVLDFELDREMMKKALNLLFERNDALRTTFVKKDKKVMQYFADERTIGEIPVMKFDTQSAMDSFILKFRKKPTNCFKGRVLEVVFAKGPDGKDVIFFKVSHFVADTYGIAVIVGDLFAVYKALCTSSPLPPAPGSFEAVLKKTQEWQDDADAVEKDREFFRDYYANRHPEHPVYCGLHGDNCDYWLKQKRKGRFSIPYLFVKCDTVGYRLTVPAAITEKAFAWCEESGITIATFLYYCYALAASIINGKEPRQSNLMLLDNRATLAERKCAGTMVQSINLYTTVDYGKSFNENIRESLEEQNLLYRHTKLSYVEVEGIQHEVWKHSLLHQTYGFCYSFIPFKTPEGVKMQIHSNGKGALAAYIAMMLDPDTKEISVTGDIQTVMTRPEQFMEFHNLFLHVLETVLAAPERKLNEIF